MDQDEVSGHVDQDPDRGPGVEQLTIGDGATGVLAHIEAELANVEHALERLDDGTYGICEACGRPIGDDRLETAPAARFCVDHEAPGGHLPQPAPG